MDGFRGGIERAGLGIYGGAFHDKISLLGGEFTEKSEARNGWGSKLQITQSSLGNAIFEQVDFESFDEVVADDMALDDAHVIKSCFSARERS